jgi:hypothetical protein
MALWLDKQKWPNETLNSIPTPIAGSHNVRWSRCVIISHFVLFSLSTFSASQGKSIVTKSPFEVVFPPQPLCRFISSTPKSAFGQTLRKTPSIMYSVLPRLCHFFDFFSCKKQIYRVNICMSGRRFHTFALPLSLGFDVYTRCSSSPHPYRHLQFGFFANCEGKITEVCCVLE